MCEQGPPKGRSDRHAPESSGPPGADQCGIRHGGKPGPAAQSRPRSRLVAALWRGWDGARVGPACCTQAARSPCRPRLELAASGTGRSLQPQRAHAARRRTRERSEWSGVREERGSRLDGPALSGSQPRSWTSSSSLRVLTRSAAEGPPSHPSCAERGGGVTDGVSERQGWERSTDLRHPHVKGPLCSEGKPTGGAVQLGRAHADIGENKVGALPPCSTGAMRSVHAPNHNIGHWPSR